MWPLIESHELFPNYTNSTFVYKICTGSRPTATIQLVIFSLILVSSLVGNVLVVAVVYRDKTLRTSVNYFIVNMSISDLIVPTISLPMWITITLNNIFQSVTEKRLLIVLCEVSWTVWGISTQISLFSMTAMAADRFRAIIFPTKSLLFSQKRRFVAIAIGWILVVPFFGIYLLHMLSGNYSNGSCIITTQETLAEQFKYFLTFFCTMCFFVFIVSMLYLKMTIFLYRQKNSLHLAAEVVRKRAERNRKTITMLLIIIILFYVVWIPFYVLQFVSYINPNISLPCLFVWLADYVLPMLYPVINPLVYYVFNAKYRQGFKEIFRIMCFCNKEKIEKFKSNIPCEPKNRVEICGHVNQAMEMLSFTNND